MTPTQISRLCELEPERFSHFMGALWWDPRETKSPVVKGHAILDSSGRCDFSTNAWSLYFWMLQTMRARFDDLYEQLQAEDPWSNPEYMALDEFMVTEATSLTEEAVINAYIEWLESKANYAAESL